MWHAICIFNSESSKNKNMKGGHNYGTGKKNKQLVTQRI